MTLWAWARRRAFPNLPAPESRLFQVVPDARVLAHCYWHRDRTARATILGLHGLEGSSRAHYMQGLADKAWAAGFNVVLLNQRNCGGTEHLCSTLYHSGLSADADWVLRELAAEGLPRFGVVGYSLGGNLALKLAGDYGGQAPSFVKAVVAVSPVMDLPRCVDALERGSNFAYQWNFVRNLKGRMRRKVAAFPQRFSAEPLDRIRTCATSTRPTRRRTSAFATPPTTTTAPPHSASSIGFRCRRLIISAADDPFVPPEPFSDPAVPATRTSRRW